MRHLDLFSGIGGFALAAQATWGPEYENVGFCDIDKFAQATLKKHWPKAKIYNDIKTLHPGPADLITGGFPCQPFSAAGKRQGKDDDRHLWPEMLRVIREAHPAWIIGENVAGIVNMVLDEICADLENEGYEVQPFIIPAIAVNAPHRRDRVWIVAHAPGGGHGGRTSQECGIQRPELEPPKQRRSEARSESQRRAGDPADADSLGLQEPGSEQQTGRSGSDDQTPANSSSRESGEQAERQRWEDFERRSWELDWTEVATELCGVDDGLPTELDGFKLTKAGHRVARLKALGNAIVPQVAYEIMQGIKMLES